MVKSSTNVSKDRLDRNLRWCEQAGHIGWRNPKTTR
jgi:hypothetical protein